MATGVDWLVSDVKNFLRTHRKKYKKDFRKPKWANNCVSACLDCDLKKNIDYGYNFCVLKILYRN